VGTASTDAGSGRGLRDRPLGRIALLVAVLLFALLVARTCGSTQPDVSADEAVEIARAEIDFEAPEYQIRNVPRGFDRRAWIVDLYTGTPRNPGRCSQVEIDAESGDVISTRSC
jgi:Peptidase propeptide and YPEB domain